MKNLLILIFGLLFLYPVNHTTAQFRPYDQPLGPGGGDGIYLDDDLVDIYGNPIGDGGSGRSSEFRHTLDFTDFANLIALENKIAKAKRDQVLTWLRKQEETFRKEINQMTGKNYSTFATAQKEFFKLYDGGTYGNGGPYSRAIDLGSNLGRTSYNQNKQAINDYLDYFILDSWIKCGYCDEYRSEAMEVSSLGDYDHDSGPGAKFYADSYRKSSLDSFEDNYYQSGLNISKARGFQSLTADSDALLTKTANIRIGRYRNLGWEDRVFQMSAYLISANTYCSPPLISCLPSNLKEYEPGTVYNDNTLKNWASAYNPEIPYFQKVFADDYRAWVYGMYLNTGNIHYLQEYQAIPRIKKEILEDVKIQPENVICGGIQFKTIGRSHYTNMEGLRLYAEAKALGVTLPWTGRFLKLRDMCVQIPNFKELDDGTEIAISRASAATKLKLAWSAAVEATEFEFNSLRNLTGNDKPPTEEEVAGLFLATFEVMLNTLRGGSTAKYGYCPGGGISKVRFCKN
ncbi:MAG: hypothetical protein AAF554_18550 [Bacteroidota bacterium]